MILKAMSYQWTDYSQQFQEWPGYSQQYQGWNPQMMMHSGDHTVQPPSNTTPHQLTQQQHQQNNYMYRTSAQQAMNTFPPPPPPATPQTQTIAQPHQLHKYGPARTHGQQPQTSPYTPNTASMSHAKAPTTTGQQTATPKQNHPAPDTPQVQHAAQSQAPTPTSTQTTPTHTPTATHVVPTHVAVPDKWTATAECYDSNTNLGGPIYTMIQPTSWSRRRGLHGQDPLQVPFAALATGDHAIRLLSQGKFTGVVATRTAAESVFASQLLKSLRDNNIDLDIAGEACHKGPIPSKTSDPIKFLQPLVQHVIDEIKTKIPIEASLEQIHRLADTEAQLAKAQQKLQKHGIQVTPQRNTTTTPALPTHSSEPPAAESQQTEPQADTQDDDTQPPAKKPRTGRAKQKADKADKPDNADKMDMTHILNPGSMTLQDNHPTSHTDTKVTQWLDNMKDKKLHPYVKKVVAMLATINKKDRPNLIETAIRYGVPMDKVQQMSYKSLSCSGGGSIFCYLTSGSSQFHKLSSF